MKYVVQYSGGIGSWAATKRLLNKVKKEDVILLFADTKIEDEDLYRFLDESSFDLGIPITRIADGRTPWEVFKDERYLGNSRVDPCSKILKRELLDRWMSENCDPENTVIVFGIDWTEEHRIENIRKRIHPWKVIAPLCDEPLIFKSDMIKALKYSNVKVPRLYEMGFPHNNCGGFCIKSGKAHFKKLLKEMPERYAFHERKEQELREFLGKDITILNITRDKKRIPITLREFREMLGVADVDDDYEWGGCGCAL